MTDLETNSVIVRSAQAEDGPALLRSITDLQNAEHGMHDTRVVGTPEFARAYLRRIEARARANAGAILVASTRSGRSGSHEIVGFAAGWIERVDNVAETEDSNVFGYISDIYVVPARRGERIAGLLLAALEEHIARSGVRRVRIGLLAENAAAYAAYCRHGFRPYELVLEKRLGPPPP
jgi:ribosomal protein S18 acetylase RimI-like enzyme